MYFHPTNDRPTNEHSRPLQPSPTLSQATQPEPRASSTPVPTDYHPSYHRHPDRVHWSPGQADSGRAFSQQTVPNPLSNNGAFPPGWVEQLQLALAVANPDLLKQIVLQTQPNLIPSHQLGAVSVDVGVPLNGAMAADGVLYFEEITCRLAPQSSSTSGSTASSATPSPSVAQRRAIVNQICRETKLQNLGMNLSLPDAIALLQYATFSIADIDRILHLPRNGWHRSWWSMIDHTVTPSEFSIPFQRLMRSRRYADGTVTLQYKDHFALLPPPSFRTQQQAMLVHIQRPGQSIAATLAWINHCRQVANTQHGMLIYHHLSDLERQAFINQNIHLYHCQANGSGSIDRPAALLTGENLDSDAYRQMDNGQMDNSQMNNSQMDNGSHYATHLASHPVAHPTDCLHCGVQTCPMQGRVDSPVTSCRSFIPVC